ncbi:hypothetical protein [Lachnoclostridium edouardi]|uniref:hypothetical protein n=1 Tax=Lachnoclostridium edouardi TaxID=1926283 RepID=UPI000C7A6FBD|nr:hypothetical protein [Lachnoclostridium edouardi]
MNDVKNPSEIINLSLLKEAFDCGIISTDSVLDKLMSTKRERIKKYIPILLHPHQVPRADGRLIIKG